MSANQPGASSVRRMEMYESAVKHFRANSAQNLTAEGLAALVGIEVRNPNFQYALSQIQYNFRVTLPYERQAA
jgi:hypothetical protein